MSANEKAISKDTLDIYLKELGKQLRKDLGNKSKVELIIVGGASIVINYDFRKSTQDVDAYVPTQNSIKGAVNRVGDMFNLPINWLNQDFKKTKSFSNKLTEHSEYYKTFGNVLEARTIKAEYLIAMKLCSMRPYKNDKSDITGVIKSSRVQGEDITFERVEKAVYDLYNGWDNMPNGAKEFLKIILTDNDLDNKYNELIADEKAAKGHLIEFEKNNPNVLNADNLELVLKEINEWGLTEKVDDTDSEELDLTDLTLSYGGRS